MIHDNSEVSSMEEECDIIYLDKDQDEIEE
jgi:hypothetical protein